MPASGRKLRRLGPALIVAAAGLIIGLLWFGSFSAIVAHRMASEARIEATVRSKADLAAGELRRELLVIDQSLYILELEWQRDPAIFNFEDWQRRVLALTDVSLQIFMADATGIVRQSSRPGLIGDNISRRDYFRHEAALIADNDRMFIGSLTRGLVTRLWQINLARRLDSPTGAFAGIIVASFDLNTFYRINRDLDLGSAGLLLVGAPDGSIRGVGDPNLLTSPLSIAGSKVFEAMRKSTSGVWNGRSEIDGVNRIMAFATVPDYGLQVLVGVDRGEAMRSATYWEQEAVLFTAAATLLVLALAGVMLWAERGARLRHAAVLRDRAELAKTNAELAEAERRERNKAIQLQATLAGMTDGIMILDADMRLLAWNAKFPEFTGVPATILRVGLGLEDILRAQALAGEFGSVDIETEVEHRVTRFRLGASMGVNERQRPNGRVLEVRRNPLPGGGAVTLYSDITGRRRAEERARHAEIMAATGRLTAGIAHDFNNLLATVSANAEMLGQTSAEGTREAKRAAIILQAANRGARLIRQLLAFARKETLAPRPVRLNEVVQGLTELLRSTLGSRITAELQSDPQLWPALVDPVQMEHVILNLAINSRDAMPEGGRLIITLNNVSLASGRQAEDLAPGDYVVLAVADTGSGMTEDILRNAFEPFFTTKGPGEGSGLGLSQVYGFARQSGGGVRIESRVNEGTTVRVFLPRAEEAATEAELVGVARQDQ